jgi:hypothetical protein
MDSPHFLMMPKAGNLASLSNKTDVFKCSKRNSIAGGASRRVWSVVPLRITPGAAFSTHRAAPFMSHLSNCHYLNFRPVQPSFSVFKVHSAADASAILRRSLLLSELPASSRTRRKIASSVSLISCSNCAGFVSRTVAL